MSFDYLEYNRSYYRRNAEVMKARSKAYYWAHREECLAKNKLRTDPVKKTEYDRIYRANNRVVRKQRQLEYYRRVRNTPKRRYLHYKDSARVRGLEFSITRPQFDALWNKPCVYCAAPIIGIGLDRVDNTLGYSLGNIATCCSDCNRAKRTLSREAFIGLCVRVATLHGEKQ